MRGPFAILFFLLLFSLSSCSNYLLKQEQDRQKNNLATAIVNSSQRTFTIMVYPVVNQTKNSEIEYITKASAEIIANYLKPMQNEVVIIPYEYKTNQEIRDMILATNSVYSNYTTNMETVSTQYIYNVFTNYQTNFIGKTNWTERFVQKKKTREMEITYDTNSSVIVTTNITVSGISKTNRFVLTDELYHKLVDTEFPELTNSLSRIPISIMKDLTAVSNITNQISAMNSTNYNTNIVTNNVTVISPVVSTNTTTNYNNQMVPQYVSNIVTNFSTNNIFSVTTNVIKNLNDNFAFIYGSFNAIRNKNGPNDIQMKLTVTKYIISNQVIRLNLNTREDLVSERLYEFLKPIRKFILDRPTGDAYLVTDPEDANIYLDGTYIGKSPLYYPAVLTGNHQFTFLKPGFTQSTVRGEILEDKTNVIRKIISKLKTGGTVNIESDPSNANVFVESTYVGNTPLTLTNLSLDIDHRVKIMNTDTNLDLPPYYHSFKIRDNADTYNIRANMYPNTQLDSFVKQTLWWTTIASWGTTLGIVGLNIFAHYQSEYFQDYYQATGLSSYNDNYLYFLDMDKSSMTYIVIGVIVSLGFTGVMLYNNEVYLGLNIDRNNSYYACATVRF